MGSKLTKEQNKRLEEILKYTREEIGAHFKRKNEGWKLDAIFYLNSITHQLFPELEARAFAAIEKGPNWHLVIEPSDRKLPMQLRKGAKTKGSLGGRAKQKKTKQKGAKTDASKKVK